ncbi:MAG TPA: LamG-like jellyroll fold domain-containing protein, partial [Gemmatirosa sp.]
MPGFSVLARRRRPGAARLALLPAVAAAALAATVAPAGAQGYNATIESTPGLLGYYTFTPASQANSAVNGYTGTLMNGATVGGPGSGPNISDPSSSALILDNGASGTKYATAGGSNPLMGGIGNSGSIVAWIDLASLPSTQGRIFSIAGESQGGNDFDLQVDGDNTLRFYTEGGANVAAANAFTANSLNQWVFVAATFTGGMDRSLYLDGMLSGSNTPGGHS